MRSLNHVYFTGNVGNVPELKESPSGKKVCRFHLAVDTFAGKDEQGKLLTEAMWLSVAVWGEYAPIVQSSVKQGAPVFVYGRLRVQKYTDKEGQKQTAVEVVASEVKLLNIKAKQKAEPEVAEEPQAA